MKKDVILVVAVVILSAAWGLPVYNVWRSGLEAAQLRADAIAIVGQSAKECDTPTPI